MQRCADEEGFDAVTLDETGTMVFFKGSLVWKGFTGAAEPINESWPEIQGPVDAALRIHYHDHPEGLHDNVLLFQGKRVWAYHEGSLRLGYPKLIEQEFPGIPADLDAAVECHPKECPSETIVFFQGSRAFSYDLRTKAVKQRAWPAISNCTAAVRWLERYYCFQGIRFLRFNPLRGDVPPHYPLDARDYFMHCPGRGHGRESKKNTTLWGILDACSGRPFLAFSSDDPGRIYAFRGGHYFRVDSVRDGLHAWLLNHTWSGLEGEVDAAFSWADKLYFIQEVNSSPLTCSRVLVARGHHSSSPIPTWTAPSAPPRGSSSLWGLTSTSTRMWPSSAPLPSRHQPRTPRPSFSAALPLVPLTLLPREGTTPESTLNKPLVSAMGRCFVRVRVTEAAPGTEHCRPARGVGLTKAALKPPPAAVIASEGREGEGCAGRAKRVGFGRRGFY
uniref:Hemopexin n=1 Tax=Laticauda laticaudata TaxID=8630 RepID=A0A8C5SPX1_LATLA